MSQLDLSAENFQAKFEQFLMDCEEAEQEIQWNCEEYGEMQDYYAEIIVSIILRIVTSEGWISDEEVEYLNLLFGFSYEGGELEQVFEGCRDMVTTSSFETELKNAGKFLENRNAKLYQEFCGMVALVGDVFSNSENLISDAQKSEILHLQALLI